MQYVRLLLAVSALIIWAGPAMASHDHDDSIAHIHIGVNPTWRPDDWNQPSQGAVDADPTDNTKLWLFSMPPTHPAATPGWPNWEHSNGNTFLVLSPVLEEEEPITKPGDPNKTLHTCCFLYSKDKGYGDPEGAEHLDGWGSAFGPQGAWNLAAGDVNHAPTWNIQIRRERVGGNLDESDFLMLLPDDTPVIEKDGDIYILEKEWLADENAWGIHAHLGFYFWLDAVDTEVSVVLSAHDTGGLYQRSAEVTLRFARTVIVPIQGDLNNDGAVDQKDLHLLNANWGRSGIVNGTEVAEHEHEHHQDHDHEE